MKICYFGTFDPAYERNRVLITGLQKNGVDVTICNVSGKGSRILQQLVAWWKIRGRYDFVIVGYSDKRSSVVLARLLFRCPIIWDAFYSLYDTYVFDRKLTVPHSFKARYYWFMDWFCCWIVDCILLDTDTHIQYFVTTFHVKKSKCIRSFVGASDDIFSPASRIDSHDEFRVLFFGNFIPLQGVSYIIQAAKLLEHEARIHFDIIGDGQTYREVRSRAINLNVGNITFHERQSLHDLVRSIARADVCLGIFGDTDKAQRVIPNKIYEAIAMKKPVISADTPALRELFADGKNILLCRAAHAEDLAEKITLLLRTLSLREHLALGGYETYRARCTPKIIGAQLLTHLPDIA